MIRRLVLAIVRAVPHNTLAHFLLLSPADPFIARRLNEHMKDMPTVPVVDTRSGEVFPYRLERAGPNPGCVFGCCLGVAICWNGIVGAVMFGFTKKWIGGVFKWYEALPIILCLIIGLVIWD